MVCGMVHVRPYRPQRGLGNEPFGFLHLSCHLVDHHGHHPYWRTAGSVEAADEAFPDRRLYKCTLPRCYGPNNDRVFPPEWRSATR